MSWRRRCEDAAATMHVENVVEWHQAKCSCGWESRLHDDPGLAAAEGDAHRVP